MNEIRKFVAPEFVFGASALELAGKYVVNFGSRKPLVVTDSGVIAAGWTQKVFDQLNSLGIEYPTFSDISPNPRDYQVMAGAEVYLNNQCDLIIAIGGGSAIDCAKAIGIVATNGIDVAKFEGVDNVEMPGPPLICIPTTSGSSADLSQFSIINDSKRRIKFAIISSVLVPDLSLIDPSVCTTMSPFLVACTGMDALVHAIETFVSTASSAMTDLHAQEAIRLTWHNLPQGAANPGNIDIMKNLMQGSLHAGIAFSNASLGAVHSLSHCLGGYLDLPHGECNSLLLEHTIGINYKSSPERFDQIAAIMGIDLKGKSSTEKVKQISETIREYRIALGITDTLARRGLNKSDISLLADNAIHDPCLVTNPAKLNKKDLEVIYEESL